MADLQGIAENLIEGRAPQVAALVGGALAGEITPQTILNEGLMVGMDQVGRRFKANEIYIPEVLIAARAMHAGMDVLRPLLAKSGSPTVGRVVLGTVQGDRHDIGKNLVGMLLTGAGFEVTDIGVDAPADRFKEAVKEHKPHIVGISALLTTTMMGMSRTVDVLREAGISEGVKVIVGGAPVTAAYAEEIGADGYAADAASAVDLARQLVGFE